MMEALVMLYREKEGLDDLKDSYFSLASKWCLFCYNGEN